MRRRRLLSSAAALAVGCLSGCSSLSSTDPPATQTPQPLPTTGDGGLTDFDAGEPFDSRRVGTASDDAHHRAVIWNDDAERRQIGIRLRRLETGETALDAAPTFPAYGALRIDVFHRADYVLHVDPPGETNRRLGVRRDFVDCNDSATHVAVRPDGSVRAQVISTALACDVASTTSEEDSSTTPEEDSATTPEEDSSTTPEEDSSTAALAANELVD